MGYLNRLNEEFFTGQKGNYSPAKRGNFSPAMTTVESLLLELEKIRKIELQNGEVMVTELTRKQKEIIEKMSLCA